MQPGILRGSNLGELPRLGTRQIIDGYNLYPWLRAVVDKIGDLAGGVQWTVGGKSVSGKVKPIGSHPILDFLDAGNGCMSGLTMRTLSFKYLLLVGEFFWLIERNGHGMPIAAWPVPPSWIMTCPTFADQPGSVYVVSFRQWRASIPARDVIHIFEPNPTMPYGRGAGRASALGDELETDEYAARFMKSFYVNGARPDILITAESGDEPIGKEAAERLEEGWLHKLQGYWKAHRPYFLTGGPVKITTLGQNSSDMQFIDQRKFNRDVILQTYGFPPEALGILENSNRATIDAAEFFLTKHNVLPKLNFVASEFNRQVSPMFDKRLVIGFVSPVQVDKEQRIEIIKAAPQAFSFDDIRAAADVPLYGGDKGALHAIPLNFTVQSLEDAASMGQHQVTQAANDAKPDADDPTDTSNGGGSADTDPADDNDSSKAIKREQLNSPQAIRKDLTPDQRRKLAALAALLLASPDTVLAAGWSPVQAQLYTLADSFGQAEYDAQGASGTFSLNADLKQTLDHWTVTRGHLINATTGAQVAGLISASIEASDAYGTIIDKIGDYFDDMNGRDSKISDTETGRVATLAQGAAFKQLGVTEIEWLSQQDERVRDTHVELDGQKITQGSYFVSSSGAQGPGPRMLGSADEDVNCRCFLVASTDKTAEPVYRSARYKQLDSELTFQEKQMQAVFRQAYRRQARRVIQRI